MCFLFDMEFIFCVFGMCDIFFEIWCCFLKLLLFFGFILLFILLDIFCLWFKVILCFLRCGLFFLIFFILNDVFLIIDEKNVNVVLIFNIFLERIIVLLFFLWTIILDLFFIFDGVICFCFSNCVILVLIIVFKLIIV